MKKMTSRRLAGIILSTLSMYLITHLVAFVAVPIGLGLAMIDTRWAARLKKHAAPLFLGLVGKTWVVRGMENIDPQKHYVIIANYPSSYAGFVMMGMFPQAEIVVAAFLSRIPVMGALVRRLGATFVDPGSPRRAQASLVRMAESAGSTIIFPEGGRTQDGTIQPFRRGFIKLIRAGQKDLLMLTLNGFYALKPAWRFYMDPRAELDVTVHPAIFHRELAELDDRQILAAAQEKIEADYRP